MTSGRIFGGLLLVVLAAAGVWIATVLLNDTPEKHAERVEAAILRQCQNSVRSLARFGDSDRPGYAKATVENGLMAFDWAPGSFYFLNGENQRVPQSARCVARLDTQTIIFLQLLDRVVVDDR
jgi:hypothetical protein